MTPYQFYDLPGAFQKAIADHTTIIESEAHEILEELALVHEFYPSDLQEVLTAIEQGKIKGDIPVSEMYPGCGCFYGHLSHLDDDECESRIISIREWAYDRGKREITAVESLVIHVRPGDTDQTDSREGRALKFLKTCILYTIGALGEKP